MKRETVMIRSEADGRRLTLASLRARIDEIEAAGVDPDSPLVDWYNPTYMRDEVVVELPQEPLDTLPLDDLIGEFKGRIAPMMSGEAEGVWAEIERRLRGRA